jgi:serpin B
MNRRLPLLTAFVFAFALAGCSSASPSHETGPIEDAGPLPHDSSTGDDAGPDALGDDAGPDALGDDGGAPLVSSSDPRTPASSISATTLKGAVTANNAFALDLYARVRAASTTPTDNLLTAPLSASLALTMTYAGAEGDTATQMATALHFGAAASSIFDGQNALSQALASRASAAFSAASQAAAGVTDAGLPLQSDYQLEVVNSVWGQTGYTWEPSFLDVLAQSYGTGVYVEDFSGNPTAATADINTWTSTQTDGEIMNLLPIGTLTNKTRLVLVDATHVKFPWAAPFQASYTAAGTFTREDGTTVAPSFMYAEETLPYVDDGQAQIVSLPLAGRQLAVVVALPHGDLATYESGLTPASAGIAQPTSQALVELTIPKLAFTSQAFSLKAALQAMGMSLAFDATNADFSGMSAQPNGTLFVSDVLQKTTVTMEENGVEAAGATAVVVNADAGAVDTDAQAPQVKVVNLDRPFLMSIVDVTTGAVLFVGHIEDPTEAGGT